MHRITISSYIDCNSLYKLLPAEECKYIQISDLIMQIREKVFSSCMAACRVQAAACLCLYNYMHYVA